MFTNNKVCMFKSNLIQFTRINTCKASDPTTLYSVRDTKISITLSYLNNQILLNFVKIISNFV